MKVVWHMYDLKVSHVDSFEIIKVVGYLSSIHGGLTVHRLKVHDYLAMDIEYIYQGIVKVSLIKYMDSVLQELPEQLGTTASTLAADHLFTVYKEAKTQYLPEEK